MNTDEDSPYEMFAQLHPHEAYAQDPDKFFAFFQTIAPGISREDMIQMLNNTDEEGKT